jgi:hypothetical protein
MPSVRCFCDERGPSTEYQANPDTWVSVKRRM